ncbi:Flp family type IVb pilin [Rhodoblastus sp.]|uniref:Flp family type IVb pilin n=1 Tax=Rhodoblastus sp. TaxID=1962975 RepID=UPI003F988DBF
MKNLVNRFMQDQSGATAIEYGLLAALIALAIISSVKNLSGNLSNLFNQVSTNL